MIPTQGSTSVHMAGVTRESMIYLSVLFFVWDYVSSPTGDVTILDKSEGHDPHDTSNADTIRSSLVLVKCGNLLKETGVITNNPPRRKIPVTAIFLPFDIFRRQIIGMGRPRMMTSVRRLDIEFPQKNVCGLMQVPPGIVLSQLNAMGLHWKRTVKNTATHHMKTIGPTMMLAIENLREVWKTRR